jgi:hypothetical protein
MRAPTVWCSSLLTMVTLSLAPLPPAGAETPAASAPVGLDATHFVVVRGDRLVIYEVAPKKGYDLRVLNSALVDESGRIVGQFRPDPASAVAPPAAAPAPEPEPPMRAPVPPPYSANRATEPAPRAHAKASPRVAQQRRGCRPSAQRPKLASAL